MKKHLSNKHRQWVTGYLFISLWVVGVCIFTLWPIIQAFYYSLCEATFKGNGIVSTFTWFNNFKIAFTVDEKFPSMLLNYLLEIVIQVPFTLTFALIISMILNQKLKGRVFFRLLFFLPAIIISGPIISGLMGQGSISLVEGGIGDIITNLLPTFFAKLLLTLFEKMILVLWYTGIPILVFLAGLQRLNKQVYEAADIDGASSWQKFWKITLPSMAPFVLVNAVYMIVTLSNSSLIQNDPDGVNQSIIQYIQSQYLRETGRGYGYACALGIIYLFIILLHIGFYALVCLPKKPRRKRR